MVLGVFAAWGGVPDGNQQPNGWSDVCRTAAHCVVVAPAFGFTQLFVSFDSELLDADGPANVIGSVAFAWDPGFGHDLGDLHDLGVILLPAGSVTGIAPVQLPPAGYLDGLKAAGTLKDTPTELVGYGVVPAWQQPGGTQFSFDGVRRTAAGTIKGLT